MNSLKTVKIILSPLRLHSASSIQIPHSTNRYNSMLPSVYVSPLNLHWAIKINLHGVSDSVLFRNHLKVCLSPLKSHVLRNSRSKYRRSVVYPSISKCNAKRCSFCKHLCCKSTDVIYVLFCEEKERGMHYVGQTCRFLKTRFSEHYRRIKSLAILIIFFIGMSNKLITLLAVFLFSLFKSLHVMIIPLKDITIFLELN